MRFLRKRVLLPVVARLQSVVVGRRRGEGERVWRLARLLRLEHLALALVSIEIGLEVETLATDASAATAAAARTQKRK